MARFATRIALAFPLLGVAIAGKPWDEAFWLSGDAASVEARAEFYAEQQARFGTANFTVAERPKLALRADGTFRIVQIADMHYTTGSASGCADLSAEQEQWACSDLNTTALIDRMLDIEDPDLVVFTGDNIVSTPDPEAAMTMAFGPVIARGYPWAAVFGNHDAEGPWPRARLMEWITAQPHALAVPGPDFGPLCVGNYRLDVAASTADDAPSALTVYMLDSRAYSEVPGVGGYDWVHADQIAWYEAEAAAVAAAAAPRAPPPALAFFHIPLPEYTGDDVAATRVGTAGEGVCAPAYNSELAASLLARDVVAVSVGHDHNNDFCGSHADGAASLALCYGGGGGYDAYGSVGFDRRSRVFVVNASVEGGAVATYKRAFTGGAEGDATVVDAQSLYPYVAPQRAPL